MNALLLTLLACKGMSMDPAAGPVTAPELLSAPPVPATVEAPPAHVSKVTLDAADGPLVEQLRARGAEARAAGLTPVAYLGATWCPPCVAYQASLDDPRMVAAHQGVRVLAVDADAFLDQLDTAGLDARSIPAWRALGEDGRAKGPTITGEAWGDNTSENMAPPLGAFFAGATGGPPPG